MGIEGYEAQSGRLEPAFIIEVQTLDEDVDRILDSVIEAHPLGYGNYGRNAAISAVGRETARPRAGSTTDKHGQGFSVGGTETYPMVVLTFSIERDVGMLARVMDAIIDVHHYEEPVIHVREAWVSRANYNPDSDNPHRWWNNGRGLPERLE